MLQAQVAISGRATDGATGEPLAGVTVQVKGTQVGAVSQVDGTYRIANVPAGATTLVFSFVGFTTQEIAIGGRTVIDVVMQEEVTALQEIVVTGYSVERKKDIIGSVSVVNTEEMLTQASGSASSLRQGRVAGLTVNTTGEMGGEAKVRVRGFGSFGSSDPLYIIDGVPGSINNINPSDIQSVQVLKDAASASVYGARAANGVVIVTTKQGQQGAIKVNFDAYYGINYFSNKDFPDLLDAKEMGVWYWKSMEGAGRKYGDANWTHPQYGDGPEPVIPEYILVNKNGSRTGGAALEKLKVDDPAAFAELVDPANYDLATWQIVKSANTDWFDEVYNPAPVQNYNLTASGGSDRGTYVLGLNYYNEESTTDKYYGYLTRYYIRANSTFNIKNIIRLGENLQIRYQESRGGGGVSTTWTMWALLPVYDIAGGPTGAAAPGIVSVGDTGENPIARFWRNRFNKNWSYGLFGNVFAEIEPVKDLVIRTSYGLDLNNQFSRSLSQVTYERAENQAPPNSLTWNMSQPRSWTFTNTLTYSKTFGRHTAKIVLGTEAIDDFSINVSTTRANFLIDNNLDFLVIDAGIGTQTGSGSKSHSTLFSTFGRFDYSYADKYILNATVRRDGSSKFGINNRYGVFPSVAVGWRVSSESFMQSLTWLTDLKLRASWGIIGNQSGLSNENQFTTYTQAIGNSYPIQGTNTTIEQSFVMSRLGNPDARWEKSITTNVGFDASLFAGALTVDFNYFIKETRDLLVQNQAAYTGANVTQPSINVGNVENRGVDFTVTNRGKIAGAVDYEVSANFSKYKNEVTKVLDNPEATLIGGGTRSGNVTLTKAGYPISMFYGYKTEGFYNSQEEVDAYKAEYTNNIIPPAIGRWRVQDTNGDKVVNDLDRTYIGSPHPDFEVGLNLQLSYAGFDASAFLFWSQGAEIFDAERVRVDFNHFAWNRSARMLYQSWTPELKNKALLPKLDLNDTYSNTYIFNYNVSDASYLRLRQVQLGYTIPTSITSKIRVDRLRVYVSGQNLFTIDNFSGLDPGMATSGSDLSMGVVQGTTPTSRQLLFGVNLGF